MGAGNSRPMWPATMEQASAYALIASAEFEAAHLALPVVEASAVGIDVRQAKEWRDITGVVCSPAHAG